MARCSNRLLVPVLALLVVLGCSSGGGTDGPGQVVQDFYKHLNDGDYDDAMSMYSAETREVLAAPDSGFAEWAKSETKSGKVDAVEVVSQEDVSDEAATVRYEVVYEDGSKATRSVSLTFEDGVWKLGFIG